MMCGQSGWAQDPNGPLYVKRTLIQHFDGNTWNIVQSPNPRNDTISELHSVAAVSANDVWAVGSSSDGKLPSRTLIQHWDGAQWTIVSSPNPDNQFNELRGVAAISANNVWAVGYRGGTKSETPIETFILHWDGARWSQVATPNIAGGGNQLFGITAIRLMTFGPSAAPEVRHSACTGTGVPGRWCRARLAVA